MTGKVAILGTGPMAVMLALEMVRKATPEQLHEITFISRDEENDIGRGQIGKTRSPHHLLNVLGAKMSGDPEATNDFVEWAKHEIAQNTQDAEEMIAATAFFGIDGKDPANNYVSRKFHSQYMNEWLWQKLQEEARTKGIVLHPIKGEIERVEDKIKKPGSTVTISLKDGRKVEADVVDLAFGLPPKRLENEANIANVPGFVLSLYQPPEGSIFAEADLRERDTKDMTVVFIGSGLSTVDGLGQLAAAGYEGKIKVISPSGRLPVTHKDPKKNYKPYKADYTLDDVINVGTENGTLKAKKIYEFIVLKAEQAVLQEQAWQDVIDGFRAHIPALWKKLDNREKKEFFDHYYPLWGDVRHRIPQQVEDKINALLGDRIEFIQGRVKDVYSVGNNLQVAYEPVNERDPSKRGIKIIEAHGEVVKALGWDFKNLTDHPLLQEMHEADMIRRGILGLGLQAHEDSKHNIRIVGQTRFQDELELTGFGELRPHAITQAEKTLAMLDVQKQAQQEAARNEGYNLQHRQNILKGITDVYDRYRRDLDKVIEDLVKRDPQKLESLANSNSAFAKLKKGLEQTEKPTSQLVDEISDALSKKGSGLFDIFRETAREQRPQLDEKGIEEFLEARRWTMATVRTILPDLVKNNPDFLGAQQKEPINPEATGGYGKYLMGVDGRNGVFTHIFAFDPKQSTVPHTHISRCTSYLLEGSNLREITFATAEEVKNGAAKPSQRKIAGNSTMATPIEEDHAYDWHIIINNGKDRALLFHVYDGAELLPDGSVRFETNRKDRPNSVKEYKPELRNLGEEMLRKESVPIVGEQTYPMTVYKNPENLRETRGLSGNNRSPTP